jgi:NNP family nitrate/nitrite transporter-like MFS transporter
MAFFAAFVSTFAPAAVLPLIRDSCNLTKTDLGNAAIAAVCGESARHPAAAAAAAARGQGRTAGAVVGAPARRSRM